MATKRQIHSALFFFAVVAILLAMVDASPLVARAPLDDQNTINLPISGATVTVHSVILSIILFITGGYLTFAGGVHQYFTMFIVGFYVGSNIAYIILTNAKDDYGPNTDTILLVVSVVVGILAGALLSCCFFLAVYLLGALLGYMAAIWLLSWVDNGLIQSNWGRAVLIICFVIVGVLLMAFLERPMIIIATAFIGSFVIFVGIDLYVKTGFVEAINSLIRAKSFDGSAFHSDSKLRGMLGGCLALAVAGCLIQWLMIRRRTHPPMSWSQRYPAGQYGWRRV
ncbi:uncharacterized protein BYT42DRAFT_574283 [Radiomyces spectabilis]|uniref:uncharacterized protein n=1 Tax=Radiomyces spectabilis TaxID=64574 RepID=UPI002220400C|nr:uncharacterized protein BYT42DRAFT_574283 [Radiomyces spectabilis]KAI8376348.1 hypothetical protein BYT42DRAFT_574283 [Radiomyces spectabilis]